MKLLLCSNKIKSVECAYLIIQLPKQYYINVSLLKQSDTVQSFVKQPNINSAIYLRIWKDP